MSLYDRLKIGSIVYYHSGPRITEEDAEILCGRITEIQPCPTYLQKKDDGSIVWDDGGCQECKRLIGIDNKRPNCFMYGKGQTILIDVQNELISQEDFSL